MDVPSLKQTPPPSPRTVESQTSQPIAKKNTTASAVAFRNAGNYEEALKILDPLMEARDPQAHVEFGYMCEHGLGVKQSYEAAFDSYKFAANISCDASGYDAYYHLGFLSQHGLGVVEDLPGAFRYYETAAKSGKHTQAHINFGHLLIRYFNPSEAMKHYETAAQAGSVEAHYAIVHLLKNGAGVGKTCIPVDKEEADQWFHKADVLEKSTRSAHIAQIPGVNQSNHEKYEAAFSEFETLSENIAKLNKWLKKDDDAAALQVGLLHRKTREHQKAIGTFAARPNSPLAQCELGLMYHHGFGVPQDYQVAKALYLKSAAAGCSQAMFNLGHMCEYGLGVKQDIQQALDWYQQAADKKYPPAVTLVPILLGDLKISHREELFQSGLKFKKGKEIGQSYTNAIRDFSEAHDKGHPQAAGMIKECQEKLAQRVTSGNPDSKVSGVEKIQPVTPNVPEVKRLDLHEEL